MKRSLFTLLLLFSLQLNADTVELKDHHITLKSFDTVLVRTPSTPQRVVLKAPTWATKTVCTNYETDTHMGTCEGHCTQDYICTGDGDEKQCSYVWNCEKVPCEVTDTYCTEYGPVGFLTTETVKLIFRGPRHLESGTQTFELKTSSEKGKSAAPVLTAETKDVTIKSHDRRHGKTRFIIREAR